jgi:hypothetical protein
MNLINYEKMTKSNDKWKVLSDFREMDHSKLILILKNMLNNVKDLLGTGFKYDISVNSFTSDYLAEKATYYEHFTVNMKFGEHDQSIKLFPRIIMVYTMIHTSYNNYLLIILDKRT